MSSVTQRINEIKQPRGGYIKPSSMEVIEMKKNEELYESENVAPSITGMVVDYMTRFLMTGDKKEAFSISIRGAEIARANAEKYLKHIKKLDEKSIVNACKLVTFDVWYRNTMNAMYAKGPEETNPDKKTIDNIRIMIERSLEFWKLYGPIIKDGFTFEPHGYTNVVNTGDGDYLTVDTLWDFKVSKAKPTNKHTLQLLMYPQLHTFCCQSYPENEASQLRLFSVQQWHRIPVFHDGWQSYAAAATLYPLES